jgi:hypothetical protein
MASYDQIGPYTTGYWLVQKSGLSTLVDYAHLPAQGQGYQYYWIGNTPAQYSRFGDALGAFGLDIGAVEGAGSPYDLYGHLPYLRQTGYSVVGNPGGFNIIDGLVYGSIGVLGTRALGRAGAAAGGSAAARKAAKASTLTTAVKGAGAALATADFLGVAGKLSFWKGLGLVLAGTLILVFAGVNLRSLL